MATVKNVAIAGASGSLGSVVFAKLASSGKFNVRVLQRIGSTATFPPGTDVVEVDFASFDSLRAALAGQDAVVSTVATLAAKDQIALADATAAAGVKRIIPSEFGGNLDNPKARQLPFYAAKIQVQDHIIEKAKTTDLTYTFIYSSVFLDWTLEKGFMFDLSGKKNTLFNDGTSVFSATTLSSIGDAIVGVLSHLDETKNRSVRIQDLQISQGQLLELSKKAAPDRSWEVDYVNIDDAIAEAKARLARGLDGLETFRPYLWQTATDPEYGSLFGENDNELLGLKGKTEADVLAVIKSILSAKAT
ncbi:hypothetical protein SLS62_002981 [Diatrype stigma]|uniref:NmrA-like domain-containing protein n=1 Tax=Diatrype stigma TaxID=117547 RepID=A0AAN9YRX2_9PEZI